ncbi:MAG: carbon starvation CstA family protein [bacterium]
MNVLVYLVAALGLYALAYRFYGRFLARAMGEQTGRPTPAQEINDGKDFVPTRPSVLFAHHFSTIAGAGPIVGPALGILYGIGPAWLWVVLGAIFFGAVHDFAALFASIRERGNSIAQIARRTLGETGFVLFIIFTILLILLVTSAFLSLTAVSLTSLYPLEKLGLEEGQTLLRTTVSDGRSFGIVGGIASTSVIIITILAPLLGWLVTRKQIPTVVAYSLATVIGVVSLIIGFCYPLSLSPTLWMFVIAAYTLLACQAPVWVVLQPRDFVNVQILYYGMAAMLVGIVVGGFQGVTVSSPLSAYAVGAARMGPVWPFLFITIACGAISGFHALVSGGTTSKQLAAERQARPVGYGGMLLEGTLAVLVLVAIGAYLSYDEYLAIVWPEVGNGNPILGFALAMGSLLHGSLGVSPALGTVLGILMVEGFLITTLDSAVRLNRYLFEELWLAVMTKPPRIMRAFWFNSGLSVLLMLVIAMSNGYKLIWPVFGATNQLLAALTLITISVWLRCAGRPSWFTMAPAVIMIVTTMAALVYSLLANYLPQGNIFLITTDILLLSLGIGVAVLAGRRILWGQPRPISPKTS